MRRPLKHALYAMLMAVGTSATAQGHFEVIPYYNNDPFTFCTQGVPGHCWRPVNPATGAYVITKRKCFNAYSAALFARVCPKAFPNTPTSAFPMSPNLAALFEAYSPARQPMRIEVAAAPQS